jgi:L-cysteine:1D-myo-inositol 2-amino-2-deoxy-alpha-D-glucopyranoside ligase
LIQKIIEALSLNLDTESVFVLLNNWIKESEQGSVGGNPGELSRILDTLLGLAM